MRKRRILIIDDEASFTRLLALNLGCTGNYTVRAENWAPNGLAVVRDFKPDLILLDVMMPGIGGGELAAQFQAHPGLNDIPVVFLTAAVKKEEVKSRSGIIGGFPYLAKPVNLQELIGCIEKNLRRLPIAQHGLPTRTSSIDQTAREPGGYPESKFAGKQAERTR
ncbi:MAG: response regulator [Verrucomicrobiota bacterium]